MGIPALQGVPGFSPPPAGDIASLVVNGSLTAIGPGIPAWVVGPFNIAVWAAINTSLTTSAASASVSFGSGTGLAAGNAVNSKNVPPGTTLASVTSNSGTLAFPTVTLTGHAKAPNKTIVDLPTSYPLVFLVGATVTGPGIPASTTVSSIDAVKGIATLNNAPTATNPTTAPQFFTFALTDSCVLAGTDSAALFTGAAIEYSGTVNIEKSYDGGATWIVASQDIKGDIAQLTAGTPYSWAWAEPERGVGVRVNCIAYSSGTINYRISSTGAANMALAINQLA